VKLWQWIPSMEGTVSTTILILPQSNDCVGLMSFTNALLMLWLSLVGQIVSLINIHLAGLLFLTVIFFLLFFKLHLSNFYKYILYKASKELKSVKFFFLHATLRRLMHVIDRLVVWSFYLSLDSLLSILSSFAILTDGRGQIKREVLAR